MILLNQLILAPTILNWLNIEIPINWSGESLIDYTKKGKRDSQ